VNANAVTEVLMNMSKPFMNKELASKVSAMRKLKTTYLGGKCLRMRVDFFRLGMAAVHTATNLSIPQTSGKIVLSLASKEVGFSGSRCSKFTSLLPMSVLSEKIQFLIRKKLTDGLDKNNRRLHFIRGPGSVVGIATGYGLDGPRTKSAPVQTGPGARPAPCTMGIGSFPGV
jgi:hypothetical protein